MKSRQPDFQRRCQICPPPTTQWLCLSPRGPLSLTHLHRSLLRVFPLLSVSKKSDLHFQSMDQKSSLLLILRTKSRLLRRSRKQRCGVHVGGAGPAGDAWPTRPQADNPPDLFCVPPPVKLGSQQSVPLSNLCKLSSSGRLSSPPSILSCRHLSSLCPLFPVLQPQGAPSFCECAGSHLCAGAVVGLLVFEALHVTYSFSVFGS